MRVDLWDTNQPGVDIKINDLLIKEGYAQPFKESYESQVSEGWRERKRERGKLRNFITNYCLYSGSSF